MTTFRKTILLFNSLSWKIRALFLGRRVHIFFLQLLSGDTKVSVTGEGKITIGNMCQTRRCVDFLSFGAGIIKIGDGCFFNKGCSVTALNSITIGNNVSFGNNVIVVDHNHNYKKIEGFDSFISASVTVGNNVWVGANSVILPGSNIGDDVVIAAGSIVSGIIPNKTLFVQKRCNSFVKYGYRDNDGSEK